MWKKYFRNLKQKKSEILQPVRAAMKISLHNFPFFFLLVLALPCSQSHNCLTKLPIMASAKLPIMIESILQKVNTKVGCRKKNIFGWDFKTQDCLLKVNIICQFELKVFCNQTRVGFLQEI